MDCSVEEIEPSVWRVRIASITRIVRFRADSRTFAPWEVLGAEGHVLWSATSLESAFRWIEARTGYPAEALFAQALLERNTDAQPSRPESADVSSGKDADRKALGN